MLCLLWLLPAVASAETSHPLPMWLADGERNRVYLLGSVHLLRATDHPLPRTMETAYEDAEALVMELDMDDVDPLAVQTTTNRLGLLHDGRTLADVLGQARYREAEAAARALELPFELLAKTEPWFAAVTIEQLILLRIGFNPTYGIEMHMAAQAARDGKSIAGLETVEEQLAVLDGLSPEAQGALLLQALSEGSNAPAYMDRMIDAWRHGDSAFFETLLREEFRPNRELYEAIVVRRNRAWVDDIAVLLDDEIDYLVIVGALHLVGEDGLPRLLAEQGIATRQLHEPL
ncbi:MAG TPA: TraB/GumN family protein [Woeseiaceae bacterium]|nr:TraB/GumN family protein [Woeseiaceae bacterium]